MTASPQPSSRPTPRHGYSSLQIALHWSVAALVVANWFLGETMEEAFEATREAGEAAEPAALGGAYAHIAIGVAVLLLMVVRLTQRLRRPVATDPDSPSDGLHRALAVLGLVNHWAFYGLLLAIPVLGAVAWFGGSGAAGSLHGLLVTVTLWLVVIHVGAALLHQFVLRDGLLRRMLRPTGGT